MRNADSVNDLRLRIKLDSASSSGTLDDMISGDMSLEEANPNEQKYG